jgi:hypothetical protein
MRPDRQTKRESPWLENFNRPRVYRPLRRVLSVDELPGTGNAAYLKMDICSGEFRNIAVFGDEKTRGFDHDRIPLPNNYLESLALDLLTVDLSKENELLTILHKYGAFSGRYERYSNGQVYCEDDVFDACGDDSMGVVFEVEPLWTFARDIACYRVVRSLFDWLRSGDSRSIKGICTVRHDRRDPDDNSSSWATNRAEWYLRLVPRWLPEPMRNWHCDFSVLLASEPESRQHYLAAGWALLVRYLEPQFHDGIGMSLCPNIPSSVFQAMNILQGGFRPHRAESYSDDRSVKPPMFHVGYCVASLRESLYLDLLDKAMRGNYQKQCDICGDFFYPESGKFKYCDHHSDADKKRWLRNRKKAAEHQDTDSRD